MKPVSSAFPVATLVALDKSVISRTRKLAGVFRAASETGAIDLRVMDDGRDLSPAEVDRQIAAGVRAFIVGATGVDAAVARIHVHRKPLAVIYQQYATGPRTTFVSTDDEAIADAALKAFLNAGKWNAFAYLGSTAATRWSTDRGERFARSLRRLGWRLHGLPHGKLAAALAKLPHPTAVFAANDSYARDVVEACRTANLRVPSDVAVIGVDNDEFLCESCRPPLTSVEPDFEREGYEAAMAIVRMMKEPHLSREPVACGIRRLVRRESLPERTTPAVLVERALRFIRLNALSGIGIPDVCRHLRVSRSLLDLRFRQHSDVSALEAITAVRMKALERELAVSDDPIAVICERCGFGSENHPKKLFRKRYGMSMRDWRAKHAH